MCLVVSIPPSSRAVIHVLSTNNVSNAAAGPVSNTPAHLDLPVPDFLFDDYELVNALNDITNFETNNNQLPVQNNI
jgi:hypothetical protein